jgi:hypothetical protein
MSTISSFKAKSVEATDAILKSGPDTIAAIESVIATNFPHGADLTAVEAAMKTDLEANGLDAANTLLSSTIPATRDLLSLAISNIQTFERFIALHIPKMEDGNNFGVTVQMTVAKFLKETREELTKKLESIPSYYSSRADAVDKLGLPKTSSSQTKMESTTDSTGGKDGDESKTSTTVTKEEKESNGSKTDVHRSKAVLAIDVQCYASLFATINLLLTDYVTVLDNVEKNEEKLKAPKGSGGGGFGGGSGMMY